MVSPGNGVAGARRAAIVAVKQIQNAVVAGDDIDLGNARLLFEGLDDALGARGVVSGALFEVLTTALNDAQDAEKSAGMVSDLEVELNSRPTTQQVLDLEQKLADAERAQGMAELELEEVRQAERGLNDQIEALTRRVGRRDQQLLDQSGVLDELRETLGTTREGYGELLKGARERTERVTQQLETARAELESSGREIVTELEAQIREESEKATRAIAEAAQHQEDLERSDRELGIALEKLEQEHKRFVDIDNELQAAKTSLLNAEQVDKPRLLSAIKRQEIGLERLKEGVQALERELDEVRQKRDQTISELEAETKEGMEKAVIFDAIADLLQENDSKKVAPAIKQRLEDLTRMTKRHADAAEAAKKAQDEVARLKREHQQAQRSAPAARPAPATRTPAAPGNHRSAPTTIGQPAGPAPAAGTPAAAAQGASRPPLQPLPGSQPRVSPPAGQQQGGGQQQQQQPPPGQQSPGGSGNQP